MTTHHSQGADVLRNPCKNRGPSFTEADRDTYGLRGLLPPAVQTLDEEARRARLLVERFEKPLDKFLMLDSIHATNEELYFKLLIEHIDDLRGCDAFFSVIISATDEKLYRTLGINVCCEPKYEQHRYYHK